MAGVAEGCIGHRRRHRHRQGGGAGADPRRLCGRARRPPQGPARRDRAEGNATAAASSCPPTSATRPRSRRCSPSARRPSAASTCCSTMPASARPRCRWRIFRFEKWKTVVDTNLTGMFLCTQEAIRIMKSADTRAADASSTTARSRRTRRGPRSVAYTATKHAVTGLTKRIALDGAAVRHLPAARSTSAMRRPTDRAHGAGPGRHAGRWPDGSRRGWMPPMSAGRSSTWRACRSTPTCCS